jgi:hypothetical protein
MLEARKLTRQILARGAESNAFKFYLVEHPEAEARWQAGDVDNTYRHFLLWQCAEMAKEIKVLFDPDNLASRLFPRPRALKDLLDILNAPTLQRAWTEDETIGWVYQDFNEKEKADVFDRLYKKKQKIRREDIPAATQLFTPRWIVSWLVQNTLGRHWLQMHSDSRLAERLNYLVPLGGEIPPVPLKKVREIEVLDPACGTMHFGRVAFDLLIEMYKEESEKAGSPGWPQEPSVAREEDIPTSIIAHNLFGIDIDLRAVQLSALTLYLKAKSMNPSVKIQQSNLVCADVLLLDGERLDAFLKAMQFTRPIYERIIRALWVRLKDASHVGSLLRPEEDIRSLIQREREQYRREGEGRLPFPELQQFFEKEAGEEEFWSILAAQIIQAFDEFARQQAQQGADETYFVGEAAKGLRILDVMLRRYDAIVTNPPYVFRSNMSDALASFLQSGYPRSKGDLYAAFIERCAELLGENGRLGMVTQQSFMFVSSYEKWSPENGGGQKQTDTEKALETLQTQLTDLEAFDQALQRVLNKHNERGETVGWGPEIDDGVILNLAPLHELLPSWKTEPKKYWEALERGDYDWSHTAMRYWPERVLAKCRKNKSYAIAHDCLDSTTETGNEDYSRPARPQPRPADRGDYQSLPAERGVGLYRIDGIRRY